MTYGLGMLFNGYVAMHGRLEEFGVNFLLNPYFKNLYFLEILQF